MLQSQHIGEKLQLNTPDVFKKDTRRAVASLTVPGGQEFHFPHFFLKFRLSFLIFPQLLLIFFLILALRVGESPTREGPGYATGYTVKTPVLN